ncbi:MAG: cyclodeaminase/cyclohydrolase family protein [Elusimicrobiota bacterium]
MTDNKVWLTAAARFAAALANTEATPGGGSAAGAAGAMGCGLGEMAAGISARGKKIDAARRAALEELRAELAALREDLERLTAADAAAFDAVMAAYRMSKEEPGRRERIQAALKAAGEVPLETARQALAGLRKVGAGRGLAAGTVAADMSCAAHLLRAAALCALENVQINVDSIKDEGVAAGLAAAADEVRRAL